jgi:ABC-type lipoprotein export system ATPase subunit
MVLEQVIPIPQIYSFSVPKIDGTDLRFNVEGGRSLIFVGANGSGKTRLGAFIESCVPGESVQRIPAQKNLNLPDGLQLTSLERATKHLRFGNPDHGIAATKFSYRWQQNPATATLSDFDALLQTLFAEHNVEASKHLRICHSNPGVTPPITKLLRLTQIWDQLLPHRALQVDEVGVKVRPDPASPESEYKGSQMSDGERVIFYFLGQALMTPENGLIIVDEPENHVHKAILGSVWDAAEQARADCGFIYITHDLEFAGSRTSAAKFYLRSYEFGTPGKWDVAELPENTGFPDNVVAELVGSRRPILFVEGDAGSLDLTIYRAAYDKYTVVPIGSCETVIRAVGSFGQSSPLHWLQVRGVIDADHRDAATVARLRAANVFSLPVAEIENLFLLPNVFAALAEALACADPAGELSRLSAEVMRDAASTRLTT